MIRHRLKVALALAAVLVFAGALAACGRKGPLDPPPSAAVPPPVAGPARSGAAGTPGAAPHQASAPQSQTSPSVPKKSFFLDFLLR